MHQLRGEQHHCEHCPAPPGYDLCFRCIRDVEVLHPEDKYPGHTFRTDFRYEDERQEVTMESADEEEYEYGTKERASESGVRDTNDTHQHTPPQPGQKNCP